MRKATYLKRVRVVSLNVIFIVMQKLDLNIYSMSIWGRCVFVFIVVVSTDTHSHISRGVEGRSPPESSGHGFSFCSNWDPGKTSAPDTYKHTHLI